MWCCDFVDPIRYGKESRAFLNETIFYFLNKKGGTTKIPNYIKSDSETVVEN